MPDLTLDEAADRANKLVPDHQLYLDTSPYADSDDLLIPVTLFVGGLIITGKPVTFKTWFERQAARASDRTTLPIGATLWQRTLDQRRAELKAVEDQPEGHEFTEEEKMIYTSTVSSSMFLTEARVFSGTAIIPSGEATTDMKVRYAAIDGWLYGQLQTTTA